MKINKDERSSMKNLLNHSFLRDAQQFKADWVNELQEILANNKKIEKECDDILGYESDD